MPLHIILIALDDLHTLDIDEGIFRFMYQAFQAMAIYVVTYCQSICNAALTVFEDNRSDIIGHHHHNCH